jgi:hypothetical protein
VVDLAHTSVPGWALDRAEARGAATPEGTSHVLVGVGAAAVPVVAGWRGALGRRGPVRTFVVDEGPAAAAVVTQELGRATVGVRVLVAGPVGACLRVRAAALAAGLEDDELHVRTAGSGAIDLFCVHCGTTCSVVAGVDDVVPCAGCDRNLVVYHHVSRSSGRFLGFMADAEDQPPEERA